MRRLRGLRNALSIGVGEAKRRKQATPASALLRPAGPGVSVSPDRDLRRRIAAVFAGRPREGRRGRRGQIMEDERWISVEDRPRGSARSRWRLHVANPSCRGDRKFAVVGCWTIMSQTTSTCAPPCGSRSDEKVPIATLICGGRNEAAAAGGLTKRDPPTTSGGLSRRPGRLTLGYEGGKKKERKQMRNAHLAGRWKPGRLRTNRAMIQESRKQRRGGLSNSS